MSLVRNPPPSKLIFPARKPRETRVYTIHNYSHDPFIVRHNTKIDPNFGSTVISFKREFDAINFAQMIESHKELTNEWPSTTMDTLTSMYVTSKPKSDPYYPTQLYLKTWTMPDLQVYCASNILQLFIMYSMTLKNDNVYNIKGEHLTLSIPLEKYSELLEIMFQRESKRDINDEWS